MLDPQRIIYWLFALASIFLWIYIASCFGKDVFFNLYVNRVRTFLFRPVTWVQNIAPKCPEAAAAGILLVLVLLLKSSLAKATGNPVTQVLGDGVMIADMSSFPKAGVFTAMSLLLLICQINIIRMIMVVRFGERTKSPVVECLDTATAPLSALPVRYSAIATAVGIVAISAVMAFATGHVATASGPMGFNPGLLYAAKMSLFAVADVLDLFRTLIVALYAIYIIGMLSTNRTAMGMASEWLASISRIFVNRPLGLGFIDFTPLIVLLVLRFLHPFAIELINSLT